jgi:hypothetical protein
MEINPLLAIVRPTLSRTIIAVARIRQHSKLL